MLGLLAGVFHMVNHSLYKSCLFLGAGSILYRTGTRSLNAMGGLGSVMPVTALCAVGAALAIAGVPPLNGFSSKWLLYVSAIVGGQEMPLFLLLAIVALFISLVTLASFLKYLGGAFLGPRSQAEGKREVPLSMLLPQVLLALTCVVFGLVPLWPLYYIHQALVGLIPDSSFPDLASLLAGNTPELGLSVNVLGMAFWSPPVLVVGLAILAVLAYGIQRAGAAKVRSVPVWTCGEPHHPSIVRYRASSYYLPFKQVFSRIYPSFELPTLRLPQRVRRTMEIDAWCYGPVVRLVERSATVLSKTHTGTPQMYLLWIAVGATLVVGVVSWVLT
jgi:hydrogenase-4 component B